MKSIWFVIALSSMAYSFDHSTHFSINAVGYNKSKSEIQFSGSTELKFKDDGYLLKLLVDYLYAPKYNKKYIQLNELYFSQEYKSYVFSLGKIIKYWGELEGYNVVDTFNQKNYLVDPFDKSKKIGTWSVLASKYIDNNIFELGLKVSERNQKFPKIGAPFYPFPLPYSKNIKLSTSKLYPTLHASYSLSLDNEARSEFKFIFQKGYDNKRYINQTTMNTLKQSIYKCNKYMLTFGNDLFNEIRFKLEASYTEIDTSAIDKSILVDNYSQMAVGLEKTIYNIKGGDLMLFSEYYHYGSKNVSNTDISEIYNHDLFTAIKFNFNDTGNSEIRAGLLYDVKTKEQVIQCQAKTRVSDIVFSAELLAINGAKDSILTSFEDTLRTNVSLTYYFK